MVTRLPATFGSACDEIGSTTSCVEPLTLLAQSGSMIAETASMVDGSALAVTKAQARPAMMARYNGRPSAFGDSRNVADICVSPFRCIAVIASAAKRQSIPLQRSVDCFAALAMT